MKEAEVRAAVRREIESIRKAESGVLPPTPHIVIEIIKRLKTVKVWEGLPASTPVSRALRAMVEQALTGTPRVALPKRYEDSPEDLDPHADHPLVVVKRLGAKHHRHIREIPLKDTA